METSHWHEWLEVTQQTSDEKDGGQMKEHQSLLGIKHTLDLVKWKLVVEFQLCFTFCNPKLAIFDTNRGFNLLQYCPMLFDWSQENKTPLKNKNILCSWVSGVFKDSIWHFPCSLDMLTFTESWNKAGQSWKFTGFKPVITKYQSVQALLFLLPFLSFYSIQNNCHIYIPFNKWVTVLSQILVFNETWKILIA